MIFNAKAKIVLRTVCGIIRVIFFLFILAEHEPSRMDPENTTTEPRCRFPPKPCFQRLNLLQGSKKKTEKGS